MFPRNASSFFLLFLLANLCYWVYTHTGSATQPSDPTQVVVYRNASHVPVQPIVLTMVLMGAPVAQEGLTAIKSAIMHASRPLELHLICSEDAVPVLEPRLALVQRPYYSLTVVYHVITTDAVRERLQRAKVGSNWSILTKTLIQEILVGVEKTAFVDTDMIFVVDPAQLWDTFDTLDPDVLVAFPSLGESSHAGQICTCVMLMRLERMRDPKVLFVPSSLLPAHDDWLSEPLRAAVRDGIPSIFNKPGERMPFDPLDSLFGDQGLFYVLWQYRPYLFARLSLRWDITACRDAYGLRLGHFAPGEHPEEMAESEQLEQQSWVKEAGEGLLVPGILHFNCQPDAGSNVWDWPANHNATNTWAPIVSTAVQFKWIWLNRGNGDAKVTTRKVAGVRWLDEQLTSDDWDGIFKVTQN